MAKKPKPVTDGRRLRARRGGSRTYDKAGKLIKGESPYADEAKPDEAKEAGDGSHD